jgi:hypothetical protein
MPFLSPEDGKRLQTIAARLLVLACAGDHATVDAVLVTSERLIEVPTTERVKRFPDEGPASGRGSFSVYPGRTGWA